MGSDNLYSSIRTDLSTHTHTNERELTVFSSFKGQSAIEYLMTYGWMLLVVAIVGGAVFSVVQSQGIEASSGFTGGDVAVENFGLSGSNTLDMVLRNTAANEVDVGKVVLSQGGEEIETYIGEEIDVGDSAGISTIGAVNSDSANSIDVEVRYSVGGLTNQVVSGTVSGNLAVDQEQSAPSEGEWVFVDVSDTPSDMVNTENIGDFYLMKYEAKQVDGEPVSQASNQPWTNINQNEAIEQCESLGNGFGLVSDRQWNAVAHQVAVQPTNWADGEVGSSISSGGGLYSGNTGDSDSVSYDGSNPDSGTNNEERRTLELASGEAIWDMSGNVWEWTDNSFKTLNGQYESPRQNNAPGDESWHELNEITSWNGMPSSTAPNSSWSSSEGTGRIYLNGDQTDGPGGQDYNVSAVRRGGTWYGNQRAGVFSASLYHAPSASRSWIGFRCSLG